MKRKTGRPPVLGDTSIVTVRLPRELIARIDGYAGRLQADRPGSGVTRADAMRALLIEGLGRKRYV